MSKLIAGSGSEVDRGGAVVLYKAKKKKRRYSKRLGRLARSERWIAKAAHRLSKAMESGLQEYRKRSDKSARRRKDGALRSLFRNAVKGLSKTMSHAGKVPGDLVNLITSK